MNKLVRLLFMSFFVVYLKLTYRKRNETKHITYESNFLAHHFEYGWKWDVIDLILISSNKTNNWKDNSDNWVRLLKAQEFRGVNNDIFVCIIQYAMHRYFDTRFQIFVSEWRVLKWCVVLLQVHQLKCIHTKFNSDNSLEVRE